MNTVTDTRTYSIIHLGKRKTVLRRRRVCRHCQLPFTTVETYEDEETIGHPEGTVPGPFQPNTIKDSGVNKPAIPKVTPPSDEVASPSPKKRRRK